MTLRPLHRLSITALMLLFAVGTLNASYHKCDMPLVPPAQEQASQEMASMKGVDCHSMATKTAEKKNCCTDFSCPKCFSSPLTSARSLHIEAVTTPVVLALSERHWVISHRPNFIERPPKIA